MIHLGPHLRWVRPLSPTERPAMAVHIATQSKLIRRDGKHFRITEDVSRADSDHWLVKDYPDLWKPIDVHFGVEQATAAPGEKRGGHVCDVCGTTAKTGGGLAAHKRSHD